MAPSARGRAAAADQRDLYPAKVFNDSALLQVNPKYLGSLLPLPTLERERLLCGNWKIRPAAGLYFKRDWCTVVDAGPDRPRCRAPTLGSRRDREDRVQRPRLNLRHHARGDH